MTAVAVQHGAHRQQYNPRHSPHSSNGPSPAQSRPQSFTSTASTQMRQEPAMPTHVNGNGYGPGPPGIMHPRHAVSNDPALAMNGNGATHHDRSSIPSAEPVTGETARDRRRASLQARSSSAPYVDSSQEDSEIDRVKPRPKPLLHRSKSDYGPRGEDSNSPGEEIPDWGARHGFEDHYASEEYVSQLANVSRTFSISIAAL